MPFLRTARKDEIPAGHVREFAVEGKSIALANVDGTFYAINNTCLHRGGPLGSGESLPRAPGVAQERCGVRFLAGELHADGGVRAAREPPARRIHRFCESLLPAECLREHRHGNCLIGLRFLGEGKRRHTVPLGKSVLVKVPQQQAGVRQQQGFDPVQVALL